MTSFDYQGIWPRLVATIVDGVILLILELLVLSIVGYAIMGSFTFWSGVYGGAAVLVIALPSAGLLVVFLYFVILEGLRGATVGKKLMKITVVGEDGSACGFRPVLIRNILRIIDWLPAVYFLGGILVLRSDKGQRLGDRIAKTVVIKSSQVQSSAVPAPQASRFCMNCGAELSGPSPFCPKCGAKQ
jgi:uncharacterized RDD family membrane protein YckC